MSISGSDLANEVTGRLKLSSNETTRFKVYDSLNEAQRHLLNALDHRFLTEAIKTVLGDLSANTVLYQYPADFIRLVKLWLNYTTEIAAGDPTNAGKPARLVADDMIAAANRNLTATTGYPTVSLGVEGGFEIRPSPSASVTNGYRLRYVYTLQEISASAPCLMRDNKRNLLVFYACYLSAMVDGYSEALSKHYKAAFDDAVALFLPKKEKVK